MLGPARDTPEFIVFAAAVLAPACESNASLDPQLCQSVREDGVYAEAQFDSNFVPQRLWSDPDVVAIMDYQFYVAHSSDLLGSLLPGPQPTRESILDGSYAGARTLHAYVNRERYRNSREVSAFINEYLRRPAYLNHKVVIPPDGHLRSRRPFDGGLSLTEVKLE